MKVHSKLLISNLLLIALPILFSAIFGIFLFNSFGVKYLEPLTQMFKNDNGVYSVQSLLYAYSNDVSSYNWELFDEDESTQGETFFKQTLLMRELEQELNELGFAFCIIDDENIIYSNIQDTELLEELLESTNDNDNSLITSNEIAFIKQSINNSDLVVYAINQGDVEEVETGYIQEHVINIFLIFILFFGFMVVLISVVISRINNKMILKPLVKLKLATEQISNGNLDIEIDYEKKDEFGEVFRSFNNMKMHLKKSVEERIENEEYRKNLIADISHDLRTPLTTIKGYTEGLIDGVAKSDEKREIYYNAIRVRTLDIEKMINNLATLVRLEEGKKDYNFKQININEFIEEFIGNRKYEYLDKKIIMYFKNKVLNSLFVNLDEDEFERVILNIIDNSSKYRKYKSVKIIFSTELAGDYLRLQISDNGIGVSPNVLSRLFDRFYREDEARTLPQNGNGLGLSIVKQIVLDHGGSIYAQSKNGLSINIFLPIVKENLDEKNIDN